MNNSRRIGSVDGESPLPELPELPEATIQHIQSYMNGKEAARTTLLSKSWHSAWLTRPRLDFDSRDFKYGVREFEKFATRAIERYQKLGLSIESFRLRSCALCSEYFCRKLIVKAMKIGATDLQIEMPLSSTLPQQVLRSQNLLRLSITWCTVGEGRLVNIISCPSLKSLTLNHNFTRHGEFYNLLTSCNASIEELSLSNSYLRLDRMNLLELHKLRRLSLSSVEVDVTMFSNDFASRFPCLNDVSILQCHGCKRLRIDSTSLETISFEPLSDEAWSVKFDVPNIRKFTYSGRCLPSTKKLYIKAAASREWEFDISMFFQQRQLYDSEWFLKLEKYLTKYKLSRISLSIRCCGWLMWPWAAARGVPIEVVPEPLVIHNLMIDGPSSHHCALLVRLFGICRPKFVTHCPDYDNSPLDFLCTGKSMFGLFGLKEVKMERSPMAMDASALGKKQKIVCELIWDE